MYYCEHKEEGPCEICDECCSVCRKWKATQSIAAVCTAYVYGECDCPKCQGLCEREEDNV